MALHRALALSLSLALSLPSPARADTSSDTSALLSIGWLWGSDAGLSLRLQGFRRVAGGGPDFYDLGGELSWEHGPRLSFGARHRMYFAPDERFHQSVLIGARMDHGTSIHIDLSGSFAFTQPAGALGPLRLAPGLLVLWRLTTPHDALRVEQAVGLGAGLLGHGP